MMKYLYNLQYFFTPLRGMKTRRPSIKSIPMSECVDRLRQCYRQDEQNNLVVPVFKKALLYGNKIAMRDSHGECTYFQKYANSHRLSQQLSNFAGSGSGTVVATIYTHDTLCSIILWACWMCGQIVIPLRFNFNNDYDSLLSYLKSKKTRFFICSEDFNDAAKQLCTDLKIPLITLNHRFVQNETYDIDEICRIYTHNNRAILSGILSNDYYTNCDALLLNSKYNKTTVITHRNLNAQLKSGAAIWQLTENDHVFVAYTSDYINGYINSTQIALSAGATVQIQNYFDGYNCWNTILGLNIPQKDRPNVFMSEPQGYKILIHIYDKIFGKNSSMAEFIKTYCQQNIRLMISSFKPLPYYIIKRWFDITGLNIWQDYNLTEGGIVMATYDINRTVTRSTPLLDTSIFLPLPYINYQLINQFNNVLVKLEGTQNVTYVNNSNDITTRIGMLIVCGRAVSTGQSVIEDNGKFYFITGDIVSYEKNYCGFRLLGRCCLPNQALVMSKNNDKEFHKRLNSHPSIDMVTLDGTHSIMYTIKKNHRMPLKNLQLFCAITMKDSFNKAYIIHSNTMFNK